MKIYNEKNKACMINDEKNKVSMVIIAYIAYCIQQITKTYTTFEGM